MKKLFKQLIELAGYRVSKIPRLPSHGHYDQDGLRSIHNHQFMDDERFIKAYTRGTEALDEGETYTIHWRLHIALAAAFHASKLEGDFVEAGVNKGFVSSAIMQYLNWNSLSKNYYLLDTFAGIPEANRAENAKKGGVDFKSDDRIASGFYTSDVESLRENFSQWERVNIIQGAVPETLKEVKSDSIAFLHLDMNCSAPEVATMEALWERLSPGAIILMDDYAYWGFQSIKEGADKFALSRGADIMTLPTGQGLLLKG